MTCQDYDLQLGDYVDGTLDAAARAALDVHLGTCDRCRALAADFQTIRFAALALDPQMPPPSVWPRLAARLDEEARPWWRLDRIPVWQPIAAIGMALVLTASLAWIGARLTPVAETARLAGGPAPAAAPLASAELDAAEKDYTTAIAGLEQITRSERASLDPGTADVLQVNLTAIDTAIGETRAALQAEPENEFAIESLFAALKRKLSLLQDAVALINEMRKGNREGAARIVSGINQ